MKMSILRGRFCFLTVAIWLITAHRVPAPIVETTESPTPAPKQEEPERVKVKKVKAKPEVSEAEEKPQARPSAPPAKTPPSNQHPFEGTWIGTINYGLVGDVQLTCAINAAGTQIKSQSRLGPDTRQATCDGKTMTYHWGVLSEGESTFTPNPDGKTALMTAKSVGVLGVGGFNSSATFRKISSVEEQIALQPNVPVAKAVAEKPGFVYNPFDRTATRLLDVRGKPSGSKVKDPVSGKFFTVP